jgi:hypothetical protein
VDQADRQGRHRDLVVATLAFPWAIWWLWLQLSPRLDIRTIVAIVIVALVLLAAAWWLWWWLPQRQVARIADQIPDPKDRADVEDNFRKTVGQALGGAAVLRLRHDPRLHWFAGAAQPDDDAPVAVGRCEAYNEKRWRHASEAVIAGRCIGHGGKAVVSIRKLAFTAKLVP